MRYVLLRIDDDTEADRLLEDLAVYPDSDLLTPCQENQVHAVLVGEVTGSAVSEVLGSVLASYERALELRAQWGRST